MENVKSTWWEASDTGSLSSTQRKGMGSKERACEGNDRQREG
jgi:hypothetical protein